MSIDRERWQKAGEVETNRLARLQRARESQFGPEHYARVHVTPSSENQLVNKIYSKVSTEY